jgi:hypothetical protein
VIEPLLRHGAVAMFVDVEIVSGAGRVSVDEHAERHRRASFRRTHDEVDVAGVKAERDPTVAFIQHACPSLDCPITRERPVVEPQLVRRGVAASLARRDATGRREVLGLLVTEVRLG